MTVGLPSATAGNPDRLAGLNLSVKQRLTTTVLPGQLSDFDLRPLVRCDAAVRGGFQQPAAACIFNGVQPQWWLNTQDPTIDEVAMHVAKAQNLPNDTLPPPASGTNKIIPSTLTRTTDSNLQVAQRNRATYQCRKWIVPVPADESCDEYPFASTYEGAFNEPENDYSVAAVNALKNSTEGGLRSRWMTVDRILEGDSFKVVPY